MISAATCIAKARVLLSDSAEPYRWSDDVLVDNLAEALEDLLALRPDLGINDEGDFDLDLGIAASSDSVDLPAKYAESLVHGAVARAFESDSSDTENAGRAQMHFQRAKAASLK